MRLADLASCGLGASRCCAPGDVEIAARTAWALGIRHEVVDLGAEFRREVLEPFVESYLAGETPSPCVRCNSRVKFGAILAGMERFDADLLATGHYARVEDGPDRAILRRGVDVGKDQSYFLWELTSEQLRRVRFPLGGSLKTAVRAEAGALELPSAAKPDSQEICFVPPGGSYRDVIRVLAAGRLPGPGEVVDEQGNVRGTHGGFHLFTIGQRHGLGVGGSERLYVTAIDASRNRVVVGGRERTACSWLRLRAVNWLIVPPAAPVAAQVQVRSRHEGQAACVTPGEDGAAEVRFDEPVMAPAPGQAAAFFLGDRVLGGGWIAATGQGPVPGQSIA